MRTKTLVGMYLPQSQLRGVCHSYSMRESAVLHLFYMQVTCPTAAIQRPENQLPLRAQISCCQEHRWRGQSINRKGIRDECVFRSFSNDA